MELELGFTMYHIGPLAFLSAIEESRKLLSIPPIIICVPSNLQSWTNMSPLIHLTAHIYLFSVHSINWEHLR